eukprot:Nitzschia sp. Nitz4//scaffold246_size28974//13112//13958//NITZ4_008083-RA/size28974-snap-gene-0.2-mRNA-1//1//CDS//3329543915//3231//frame0
MAVATNKKSQPIYTKEKAVHLLRVYANIVCLMLHLGWVSLIVQNPLKREAATMSTMDPSEIIATPFSLQQTTVFSVLPVVSIIVYWIIRSPDQVVSNLLGLFQLTLAVFALTALCGDDFTQHWRHSALSSVYVAGLLSTTWMSTKARNALERLPFQDYSNLLSTCRLYGVFFVSIPFHLVRVLDHGTQMQRWPLPILLGGTYGYIIGTFFGLVALYLTNQGSRRKSSD